MQERHVVTVVPFALASFQVGNSEGTKMLAHFRKAGKFLQCMCTEQKLE